MPDKRPYLAPAADVPTDAHDWGALKWLCNQRLCPDAELTFGLVFILPGHSNPPHAHPNCEELLFVVSGECEHRLGDEWVHLSAGDLIRVPRGAAHHATNNGWEPVRMIVCYSSPDRQTDRAE